MIRMIRLLLISAVLIANLASAAELTEQQRVALQTAQNFITAFEQRDAEKALAYIREDTVLEMPYPLFPGEGKYATRRVTGEALRTYMRGIPVRNSQIAFTAKVWRVSNDSDVILEANGNLVRADGTPYRNKYIMVFHIEDGRIASWREYFNPVVAARTFGIPLESLPGE